MKTGFKCILAVLAMLFGFALLSASVHAQSSFMSTNNVIPNSVTAFSVGTGGTLNFLAALLPDGTHRCTPEDAEVHGEARDDGGRTEREDADARRDSECRTTGDDHIEDGEGDHCDGTSDDVRENSTRDIATVDGRCVSTDKHGTREMATYILVLVRKAPLAPNTFTATWATITGRVFHASGTMANGYMLVQ